MADQTIQQCQAETDRAVKRLEQALKAAVALDAELPGSVRRDLKAALNFARRVEKRLAHYAQDRARKLKAEEVAA